LPRKAALNAVGAEQDTFAAVAVTGVVGFFLPNETHIKNADRPHEVELRAADIDICAILDKANDVALSYGMVMLVGWESPNRI
jgi:hypothetical protein